MYFNWAAYWFHAQKKTYLEAFVSGTGWLKIYLGNS